MPVSRIRPLPRFQAAPNASHTNSYFMPIAITTARMAQSDMCFFHGLALKYFMTFDCILLFTKQARLQSLACIVVCCLFELSSCLDRDVAVCAVDDTVSLIKIPIVVCHGFDCRFVFTGEGHIRKIVARRECHLPDACHTISNCHTYKRTATIECGIFNTRN